VALEHDFPMFQKDGLWLQRNCFQLKGWISSAGSALGFGGDLKEMGNLRIDQGQVGSPLALELLALYPHHRQQTSH
jgi:hypothetical protein